MATGRTASPSSRSKYVPPPDDFTVGWICALPIERAAASCMLDREYHGHLFGSRYTLGRVGEHNVVIVCLPAGLIGTNSAASVATQMQMQFKSIRIRLLVGIGGGVPSPADVRLGDVVISQPQNGHGGVVQYDFGKTGAGGHLRMTGFLNAPPIELLDAAAKLRTLLFEHKSEMSSHLRRFGTQFARDMAGPDVLYTPDSEHTTEGSTCANCDPDATIERPPRLSADPVIHFGTIASANQVMRDGMVRDRWSGELGGVLCYEMEAAGLMMGSPCLVIRGICDYSDQHKNKSWQPFAAAVAGAAAREILRLTPVQDSEAQQRLEREIHELKKAHPAPDPSADYNKALQSRQRGTGIWLFKNARYNQWKDQGSILWLYGIPGCGKTVLSATVIENLRSNCASESIFFYYFVFDDKRKQVTELMVRSLIYQMLRTRARPFVAQKLLSDDYISIGDLLDIFYQLVQQSPSTYIIVDALDECGDRSSLVTALETMAGWQLKELHIMITSRMERDLEDTLGRFVKSDNRICLQSHVIDTDINTYVHTQLRERRVLNKWQEDPILAKEIQDTIAGGASGMFRWAACQLDQIAKCRNRSQLRTTLSSLPPTLNATYDRILQNIEPQDIEYAVRILRWLAFSERPLLIEELGHAVAMDAARGYTYDPEQILQDAHESLDICSSLVTVSSVSDWRYNDWTFSRRTSKQTVSLAHYSVKEYLMTQASVTSAIPVMKEKDSHAILAMSCIGYLFQFDSIDKERLEAAKMAKYCSLNWVIHSRKAGLEILKEQIVDFLLSKAFVSFNRIYIIEDPSSPPQFKRSPTDMSTPLCVAVHFRLPEVVQSLIMNGVDVNQCKGRFHTALQTAAKVGDLQILEMLLRAGADVNSRGGLYHTALHAAAARGHAEVFRRLLIAKADVNVLDQHGWNALHAAVRSRSIDIVEQMISAGGHVNAQSRSGTVLHTATMHGQLEIVVRLLAAGADVNAKNPQFGTVLSTAAFFNENLIAQKLVNAGADVNIEGGDFGTALHAAAYRGHWQIVVTLLAAKAAVNRKLKGIGTPLHAAVCSLAKDAPNRDGVIRYLISGGAQVNAFTDCAGTPLHAAAHRGHESAVRTLLLAGADEDAKDRLGMTAINLARAKGHMATVEVLELYSEGVPTREHLEAKWKRSENQFRAPTFMSR